MHSKDLLSTPLREMKSIAFFDQFNQADAEVNIELMLQFDLEAKKLMEQDPGPDDLIEQMNFREAIFSEIKEAIKKINGLIEAYNTNSEFSAKKQILSTIQEQIHIIDNRYPASYFAANPRYREAHAVLFNEIKYQKVSMGIPSLLPEGEKHSPLSEIIANMAPEKADKLLGLLINGNQKYIQAACTKLYGLDDTSLEATNFRTFLNEHQLSFLGGGNSKNFLVTNINDNSQQVLKIDFRLDLPKNIEVSLRSKLSEQFSPIYADRQVTCEDDLTSEVITRSLQVTDYYPNGSLNQYSVQARENPGLIISSAANKLQQMACILFEIQEKGFMHPDAKISNWLVDEKGTLLIADTKSFVFTDEGIYSETVPGNEFTALLHTEGYYPPEDDYSKSEPYHAYTLGINLYEYVSGKPTVENFPELDYNLPVFTDEKGSLIKEIIQGLVEHDPAKRMSLKEASKQLTGIAVNEAIKKFEEQTLGFEDKGIKDFIKATKLRFAEAHDPKIQRQLLANLNQTIEQLDKDPVLSKIKTIIQNYRETASWKTIGMKAKADRIEKALAQVPIHERLNLLKLPQSKEVQALMKELASHRYPIKGHVFLNKEGKIDESRAATKYKEFKKSIQELHKKNAKEAPSSAEVISSPSPKKP